MEKKLQVRQIGESCTCDKCVTKWGHRSFEAFTEDDHLPRVNCRRRVCPSCGGRRANGGGDGPRMCLQVEASQSRRHQTVAAPATPDDELLTEPRAENVKRVSAACGGGCAVGLELAPGVGEVIVALHLLERLHHATATEDVDGVEAFAAVLRACGTATRARQAAGGADRGVAPAELDACRHDRHRPTR